jgi:hypothetical protein
VWKVRKLDEMAITFRSENIAAPRSVPESFHYDSGQLHLGQTVGISRREDYRQGGIINELERHVDNDNVRVGINASVNLP